MDLDRLKHSYAVAKKMQEIGKKMNLSDKELESLFVIGLNHDIGYEYAPDGKNHARIGGEILKENGFEYWKEVFYHGSVTEEYHSKFLDILNCADMQIDKYGNDVGFEKRLEDIKARYFESQPEVYQKCCDMVKHYADFEKSLDEDKTR